MKVYRVTTGMDKGFPWEMFIRRKDQSTNNRVVETTLAKFRTMGMAQSVANVLNEGR